jgi:hypothetical protein
MSQGGIVIALTSLSTNFIQKVHARIKKDLTCILYRKVHMDWVRRSIQAICYNKKWKVLQRSNAWWGAGSNSSAGSSLHRARKCVRLWTTILCRGVLSTGHCPLTWGWKYARKCGTWGEVTWLPLERVDFRHSSTLSVHSNFGTIG